MKRSAFTTVELLIAISIIAILGTLTFVGMKSVNRNMKSQSTRITLQNTASMLEEWSHAMNGMVNLPAGPLDAAYCPPPPAVLNPLIVRLGSAERTGTRIVLTRAVFKRLMRVPAIAKMQQNLPQQTLMNFTLPAPGSAWGAGNSYALGATVQYPAGTAYVCGTAHTSLDVPDPNANRPDTPRGAALWLLYDNSNPTLLDTFGNPILFVPATGLSNVAVGGRLCSITSFGVVQQPSIPPRVVGANFNAGQYCYWTDGKIYRASDAGSVVDPPTAPWVLQPSKPFFASAGPDGIFGFIDNNANGVYDPGTDTSGGDDNIYSFEN